MTRPEPRDALTSVATLIDPVRRRLFELVSSETAPVSRDRASAAIGISRALAAFHLDRLVEAGLLVTEFRRLTGRSGPGAGRPSKLYRRAASTLEVSIPPRRYGLAASWLADAVGAAGPASVLRERAHRHGTQLGDEARQAAGAAADRDALLAAGVERLSAEGYAALVDDDQIRLANCPFDEIARQHRELICGEMNRALLEGFAAALHPDLVAALEPRPGACCMVVR